MGIRERKGGEKFGEGGEESSRRQGSRSKGLACACVWPSGRELASGPSGGAVGLGQSQRTCPLPLEPEGQRKAGKYVV